MILCKYVTSALTGSSSSSSSPASVASAARQARFEACKYLKKINQITHHIDGQLVQLSLMFSQISKQAILSCWYQTVNALFEKTLLSNKNLWNSISDLWDMHKMHKIMCDKKRWKSFSSCKVDWSSASCPRTLQHVEWRNWASNQRTCSTL